VIPPRYWNAKLIDFGQKAIQEVENWLAEPRDGLLLTGPAGTGKTHLAAAIVRSEIEKGRSAMFRRASDFYAEIRDTFNDPDKSEKMVVREYINVPLLALDDLGSGSLSDHERRSTLDVLDQRLNHLLPTVVTTNWPISEIAERLDERIASRLSAFRVLALVGRDLRRKP
jgi:DNA replication protein DnaC